MVTLCKSQSMSASILWNVVYYTMGYNSIHETQVICELNVAAKWSRRCAVSIHMIHNVSIHINTCNDS